MRKGATRIAIAVLISRVAGLVRERLFARYLGTSDFADAFSAAMRIPALMESVLGEGVFASAFIPRYSRLLADGNDRDARRLARVVAVAHALFIAIIVLIGVAAAPLLVGLVVPGFGAEKAELTTRLVRILFPAVGLVVMGSWCLGVLSSHRRFFLPYLVPVLSAASISVALVLSGRVQDGAGIAEAAAWGALVGAALQLLVQLPFAIAAVGRGDDSTASDPSHARAVGRNVGPTALRGLLHRLGTWIEIAIAGFLSTGAIAGLDYARVLYGLPVSLFTVSIAAALLPEISAVGASASEVGDRLRAPLDSALRHAAFVLVACAVAFMTLGDVIAGAIYQSGAFTARDARYVWAILGSFSIGLVGSSMGGLYATAFYALGDTVTPLRAAVVRLLLRATLGFVLAVPVTRALGLDPAWGAAGLGAAIGITGWLEFLLLRHWLRRRLAWTETGKPGGIARLWAIAGIAAAVAWGVRISIPELGPVATAVPVLGSFTAVYLGAATVLRVPESLSLWRQLGSWFKR